MKKIVYYWREMPVQGSMLNALAKDYDLTVYATKAKVPFNLEDYLDFPVCWIESTDEIRIDETVDLFVFTGWLDYPIYKMLKEKKHLIKRSSMMIDNNLRFTPKQIVGYLYFSFWKRRVTDFIVVGRKTFDLLSFYGVSSSRIHYGNYGVPSIYGIKSPVAERKIQILYIGQYIKRKRVDRLVEMIVSLSLQDKALFAGKGSIDVSSSGIVDVGFVQPNKAIELMNNAKVLVLLSRIEHWGTVVSEALACGCFIICSKEVASGYDLVIHGFNGFIMNDISDKEFTAALKLSEHYHQNKLHIIGSKYTKDLWGEQTLENSIKRIISAIR